MLFHARGDELPVLVVVFLADLASLTKRDLASHQFASFEFALCFRPRAATEKHGPVTTRDAVGAHLNECALVAVSSGPALFTSRLPISFSHVGGNAKVFIDGFTVGFHRP